MSGHRHGTTTGYSRGCRCVDCRAAYAQYQREYRLAREAGHPTPRQVGRRPEVVVQGIQHGTLTGYNYWRCRCRDCRAAAAEYKRERRRSGPRTTFQPVEHGTLSSYRYWGCRCGECRAANAAEQRQRRAKRKDAE